MSTETFDNVMFSQTIYEYGDVFVVYDLKNQKSYEITNSENPSIEQIGFIDPIKMKEIQERLREDEKSGKIPDYESDEYYENEGSNVYEGVDREYLERTYFTNTLSALWDLNAQTYNYIYSFVKNGFDETKATIVGLKKTEEEKILESVEYEFYTEYKRLGGKFIPNFDDYLYWYSLFTTLTVNRIGGSAPVNSELGWEYFIKILKSVYGTKGINKEVNIFFSSIDSIHAYT